MKRKPTRSKKARRDDRVERGKPYQQLVAEIVRLFDPNATVTDGKWVDGPDGRLDLDVSVEGTVHGDDYLGVIECKDYTVAGAGKVGRPLVDALESKRRDLGAAWSVICSNSGFTVDAIRKARRVGIGLISVLKNGDARARYLVEQDDFFRRTTFTLADWDFEYVFDPPVASRLGNDEPRYQDLPVALWLVERAYRLAQANPYATGLLQYDVDFVKPVPCTANGTSIFLRYARVRFSYVTEWRKRSVSVDLQAGLYNHLTGAVRMAPGANKYTMTPRPDDDGEICAPSDVPEMKLASSAGEVGLTVFEFCNLLTLQAATPDLSSFVEAHDLEPTLEGESAKVTSVRDRQLAGVVPCR